MKFKGKIVSLVIIITLFALYPAKIFANSTQQEVRVTELRVNIKNHRTTTWHLQDKVGIKRRPTNHAERHTRSIPYLRWINKSWMHSQRLAAKKVASIPHLSLWLCIHTGGGFGPGEGAWNDPNSGNNGHYGGLQMTSPWGKGDYYVFRADWLSPYQQMHKAELGYKASGYSTTWLRGQWYHLGCIANYA